MFDFLSTGTGKSYVIYGIAQILLSEKLVKRVLVLCPSLTIEKGLTEKFEDLVSNPELRNAIPEESKNILPRIINANSTIIEGDICIENIHAVYESTGSSIKDSFKNGGEDTLEEAKEEIKYAIYFPKYKELLKSEVERLSKEHKVETFEEKLS